MKKVILFLSILFTVVFVPVSGQAVNLYEQHEVTVPLRFDYYYTYEMINDALKKLHAAYPQLTQLDLVGKSEEGRDIYCMTVNNPKTGNKLDKPGIYVDANIHGNEIQGSEVALYLLDYLLDNYGKIKEITRLVDSKCFYVIPCVNVDGRYHFMKEGNYSSSARTILAPRDDDNDGLVDEDTFDDLDGDGNICQMRKKDPFGQFKTDADDPRVLVRIKPGEKGEWAMLGMEGIHNDGDGRVNEDEPGYLDGNRNWGYDWQPPYVQLGAGNYPLSAVGLKSMADYIGKLPNICMVWAFHNYGGMILRGPSTKVQGEYPRSDIEVYDYLGKQAERITPGYRYIISWKDLYTTYGDFSEWMVMTHGAYSFVGELFATSSETFKTYEESKKAKPEADFDKEDDYDAEAMFSMYNEKDREQLKFNDHLAQGEMFVNWKPYKHPTYGDIEIGGWIKYSSRISHPFMLKDLVHRNASAIIFSAKHTPEASMDIFDKQKVGENLYRIRVRLSNTKAMPSMSYQAQKNKLYPKDILKVSGPGIKVIAGGELTDIHRDRVLYKEYKPDVQFLAVPGFGKIEYQFLVSGTGSIQIEYSSRHAGRIVKNIQL